MFDFGHLVLHFVEKMPDVFRRTRHVSLQGIVGVGRLAEQAGEFLAQGVGLGHDGQVLVAANIVESDEVALPCLAGNRVLHEREEVGIVHGQAVAAIGIRLVAVEIALRHAFHLGTRECDGCVHLACVLLEFHRQQSDAIENLFRALSFALGQRHTGVLEAFGQYLLQFCVGASGLPDPMDLSVGAGILEQGIGEIGDAHVAGVGSVAHR